MLQLWLQRHAQVQIEDGICYGASDLPAYADATRSAAEQAAAVIPENLPLYTSPLQRCTALAAELALLRPDLPPAQTEPRLAEMNFGLWEGQAWDAIPRPAFDAWMADFGTHRFGGAESAQEMIARVAAWVLQLHQQNIQHAACICHAGSMRALLYLAEYGLHPLRPIASVREWPGQKIPLAACIPVKIPILRRP